jgi:hypothetical protein
MAKNIIRGLPLPFKKFKGKHIENIMITHPGYIDWLLREEINDKFGYIIDHINYCIQRFDNRPYTIQCFGTNMTTGERCEKPISRLSLYSDNLEPYFWCSDCDPYQTGAMKALTIVRNYKEALDFIHNFCGNSNPDFQFLIEKISNAKGLTGRRTNEKILSFFHD